MKFVLGLIAILSFGFANAAEVRSGELSYDSKYLILGVVHGGGCGTHEFSISKSSCTRMRPPTCYADLVHKSDDPCEALIGSTVVIDLVKERMNAGGPGTTLIIRGSGDSEAKVIFPGGRQ